MSDERPERQVVVALGWVRRGAEVLLVQRHDPVLVAAHGKWELPGGKVQFGEWPMVAVAREVAEETGYSVTVGPLLPYVYTRVWEYPDRRQQVFLLIFDCLAGPYQGAPADPRIAAVAWVRPDQIDFANALPGVQEFVAWWQARLGPPGPT